MKLPNSSSHFDFIVKQSQGSQQGISELPLAFSPKQVLVPILSYENDFILTQVKLIFIWMVEHQASLR